MLRSFTEVHYASKIDGDPEATAEKIVESLKLNDNQREVLMPLVVDQCAVLERIRVRRSEADGPAGRKVADPAGARAAYLSERFAVGDGRMVKWSEATIEDHSARISFLDRMRGGIDVTIKRHNYAIKLIESHAVKCLGDIADLPASLAPTAAELDLHS